MHYTVNEQISAIIFGVILDLFLGLFSGYYL